MNLYYFLELSAMHPSYFPSLIREHWSIENQLHWHLDITFKEGAGSQYIFMALTKELSALHIVESSSFYCANSRCSGLRKNYQN